MDDRTVNIIFLFVILAIGLIIAIGMAVSDARQHGPTVHYGHSDSSQKGWRSDVIALIGIIIVLMGVIVSLFIPEVRGWLGLK